jgi:peroxiredoxin Q/BCP
MLKEGANAPNFDLLGDDGQNHTLKSYKGKWVVLYFYPKDMTPGCTIEACEFTENHDDIVKQGAVVLGVSADPLASHARFKSKYALPFLLLSDPSYDAHQKYGAYGEKVLYGKKSIGPIRSTFLIDPEGKIVKMWSKVRVKGHVAQVLGTLAKQEVPKDAYFSKAVRRK